MAIHETISNYQEDDNIGYLCSADSFEGLSTRILNQKIYKIRGWPELSNNEDNLIVRSDKTTFLENSSEIHQFNRNRNLWT